MENNKKQSKVDGRDSYLIWKVPSARREDATTATTYKKLGKNWNFHIKETGAWLIKVIYHFLNDVKNVAIASKLIQFDMKLVALFYLALPPFFMAAK